MKFSDYILINEMGGTKRSGQHEDAIASAFRDITIPDESEWKPNLYWLKGLGIEGNIKSISSKTTSPEPVKSDVIVRFDNGSFLGISAKMENASYLQNWIPPKNISKILGPEFYDLIVNYLYDFAITYKWKKMPLGIAICISTDKPSAMRVPLNNIGGVDMSIIRKVVTGSRQPKNKNPKVANCFYRVDNVPVDHIRLLSNLEPIDNKVLNGVASKFTLAIRPVYSDSGRTQHKKPLWVKIIPAKKMGKITDFSTWDYLKNVTKFVKTKQNEFTTGQTVLKVLNKYNIYPKVKKY